MAIRLPERKIWFLTSVVVGSLLMNVPRADAKSEFRDFRDDNPGVDRHQLRQMFRQMNNADRPERSSGAERRILNAVQQSTAPSIDSLRNNFDRHIINQIERGRTIEIGSNNRVLKLGSGLNLDLTSAERNIVLGEKLLGGRTVQITTGGESKSLASGARVTAAEYLAVKQALGSGQTLKVSADGSASGGTLSIDGLTSDGNMRAASLVVSEGVTAAGNFSKGSAFKLTGDLTNYGTMLVVSDRKGGSLQGDDVLNANGAVIAATGDLHIGATRTFTNDGTVTASDALTVTAGESIKNSSTISAGRDVTLYSPEIQNSGSITSNNGNVNLFGPSTSALTFNNIGGTVNALNGAINLRDTAYNGGFNTAITGGDLFSKTVNMTTGQGVMDLNVNELTGTVTQSGYAAHVSADTDSLNLGSICLTGDPTYKNAGGDVNITGDLTAEEALVIIARDDVIITTSGVNIVAGNSTTGFPVTIIAGANITAGGTDSPTLPTGSVASAVTISGNGTGSSTGGSVLFTGNSTLSSRATGKKGSGGNVFIGALKGTDLNSGSINLSGLSIFTGGRKSKDVSGGVRIAAGGTADGSTIINSIDTTGGTTDSGTISIRTAGVFSSDLAPITWNAAGAITSGNFLTSGAVVSGTAADVTINGTVISNANITITAADDILLGNSALVRSANSDVDAVGFARIFSFDGRFQADNGTIRLSAGDVGNNSFKVNVSCASLTITANVGSTFINATGPMTVDGTTAAVNSVNIQSDDEIAVNGSITAGNVTLFSTAGDVVVRGDVRSVVSGIQLTSLEENVVVNGSLTAATDASLTSQKGNIEFGALSSALTTGQIQISTDTGKISFGAGSSLEANSGGIFVTRTSDTGADAPPPQNTSVNVSGTGVVQFKGAQAKGKKPQNSITASAGTIRLGSTKKNKITLGGNVTMLSQ
jgi:hypothetical protein